LELSPPFHMDKLCHFLDKPLPSGGYPHANSTGDYIPKIYNRRNKSIALAGRRLGGIFLTLIPIAALIWYGYFWLCEGEML
jgi:hypothetical protein